MAPRFFDGDLVTLQAVVTDDVDQGLESSVQWHSDLDGALGTGASVAQTLSQGDHDVTASVTDSDGFSGVDHVMLSIVPSPPMNTEPLVSITAPLDGEVFTAADTVTFTGTATDLEDGPLTPALSWTSDRDGPIGQGGSVATALSEGTHDVTARASDSEGLEGSATVRFSVLAAAPFEFRPIADTYVRSGGNADNNFGSRNEVRLDRSPEQIAYLRFAVAGVGTQRISQATLHMRVASSNSAWSTSGGTVHTITDDGWAEDTVTYNTRPQPRRPVPG